MSQMMIWGINLFILSICIFIAGMIKPKWIFFWLDSPNRIQVQMLSVVLLMGGAILFGEANKEKHQEEAKVTVEANQEIDETPVIAKELKK